MGHGMLQPPQCCVLLCVAWQNAIPPPVPQHVSPDAQAGVHVAPPRPSSPQLDSVRPMTTAPSEKKTKAVFDI
jgi:hypothetical protein